jgi:putative transposase
MKATRFSETQILKVLKEHEAGRETKDLCREYGISRATFFNWRKKFGGMDIVLPKIQTTG